MTRSGNQIELHLQIANHQSFVKDFLLGETGSVDGFEASEEFLSFLKILIDGLLREVVESVVPAFVAQEGGTDWTGAQLIFPLLG